MSDCYSIMKVPEAHGQLGFSRFFIKARCVTLRTWHACPEGGAGASTFWIPFFGLSMKLLGFVFLERNWDADQQRVRKSFDVIRDKGQPVWFASFLEGTRYNATKHAQSSSFASENKLPLLKARADCAPWPRTASRG